MGLPIAILLRAVSGIILVRISKIDASRIGNISLELSGYMADRAKGRIAKNAIDLFYFSKTVCNQYYARRWRSYLPIWQPLRYLHVANLIASSAEETEYPIRVWGKRVFEYAELLQVKNEYNLSDQDETNAKAELLARGLDVTKPFVCFFNRDSAYLNKLEATRDWSYHNYRDSNIANYVPAAEELTKSGYLCFRMGAAVASSIATNNSHVIDYARTFRSDLLDIYLIKNARFILAAACGLGALAQSLRKEVVTVNATPFMTMQGFPGKRDIFIPKLYFSRAKNRHMTFQEILSSPSREFNHQRQYDEAQIEAIENSADDIILAAREMNQVIDGTWVETSEMQLLQQKFNKMLTANSLPIAKMPKISSSFLLKYAHLLQ